MDNDHKKVRAFESKLIGSLMMDSEKSELLYTCMSMGLSAEDFFNVDLRAIFDAMSTAYANGQPFGELGVEDALVTCGISRMDASAMAIEMMSVGLYSRGVECAHAVLLESARRKAVNVAKMIVQDAQDSEITDPSAITSRALSKLMSMQHRDMKAATMADHADNLLADYKKFRAKDVGNVLRSPYPMYGKLIGPYEKGVHLLAARQKVGKSSWCFYEVLGMARQGRRVATINLELKNELIIDRWAAAEAGVSTWALRNRYEEDDLITAEDFDRLCATVEEMKKLPIIMAPPRLTLQRALMWIQWAINEHGVEYVVLDRADKLLEDHRYKDRFEKAADYSNQLMAFANDRIAMRVVVHLNRKIEIDNAKAKNEDDERLPTSADLRNTGEWEGDAYSITLLHRKGGRAAKSQLTQNIACIVEDNRNGPTGIINFTFDRMLHRWSEVREHELPSD